MGRLPDENGRLKRIVGIVLATRFFSIALFTSRNAHLFGPSVFCSSIDRVLAPFLFRLSSFFSYSI